MHLPFSKHLDFFHVIELEKSTSLKTANEHLNIGRGLIQTELILLHLAFVLSLIDVFVVVDFSPVDDIDINPHSQNLSRPLILWSNPDHDCPVNPRL